MSCSIQVSYIHQFLESVAGFYRLPENAGFEMLTEMADFLDQLLAEQSRVYANHEGRTILHAIQHLPTAVKFCGPKTAAIANAVNQLAPFLNWQQTRGYNVLGEHYCKNYGFCSIIGPGLLIEHDTLKLGFGIWGSGLHYPLHHHAAEECYHVLGSDIQFRQQSQPWKTFVDGDAIYNKPFEIHELKTSSQPMFLLYTWRGDVGLDAILV